MKDMKNPGRGYIFEIQRMSTEDGPGIRTTVFFKECPLRCAWCHNPESISKKPSIQWFSVKCIGCETCIIACPEKALTKDGGGIHIDRERCTACGICVEECPGSALRKLGKYWTLDDLIAEVKKDHTYYKQSGGGITASGGEAALQAEFIEVFFKRCKELGFHTALDLCGILPRKRYELVLPYTDLLLYDIKEIDPQKHEKFTGVSNKRILENLIWIMNTALEANPETKIWIRTPLIPNHTATEENIRGIGSFIVEKLENRVERWDLLAYNNLAREKYERMDLSYLCKELELLTREEMEDFVKIAKSTGVKNIQWSGLIKVEKQDIEADTAEEKIRQSNIC
ncbi:MAG: glycyl-radical enzyme activating protein [Candidatus Odinarchaeota archaeon]